MDETQVSYHVTHGLILRWICAAKIPIVKRLCGYNPAKAIIVAIVNSRW